MPRKAGTTPSKKKPASRAKKQAKTPEDEEEQQSGQQQAVTEEEEELPQEKVDIKFAQAYMKQEKEHPDIVRFFKREAKGSKSENPFYYCAYGKSARFVAEEYIKTETAIKYHKIEELKNLINDGSALTSMNPATKQSMEYSHGFPSIIFRHNQFEDIVRDLLLNRSMRIQLMEYKKDRWICTRAASPGNMEAFEDIILSSDAADIAAVMCIRLSEKDNSVGLAFAETIQRKLRIIEFVDNEAFSNLESLIQQEGAKECVMFIEGKNPQYKKVVDIVKRSDIVLTPIPKADYKTTNLRQDIAKLLDQERHEDAKILINFEDMNLALEALACVIKYLKLIEDENNYQYYKLEKVKLGHFMKLDAAAMKALNLMPSPTDSHKSMSLFGLLDQCSTKMGSRTLLQWIRQPLTCLDSIDKRHDIVEVFVEDNELRQNLRDDYLKKIPDLDRLMKRLHRLRANLEDCVKIYQMIQLLPYLIETLSKYEGQQKDMFNESFIQPLSLISNDFIKFGELVETSIDLSGVENHEYFINREYDDELDALRYEKEQLEEELNSTYESVKDELNIDVGQEKSATGYFLTMKKRDEKTASKKKGIMILQHLHSKVKFTTKEYQKIAAKLKDTVDKLIAKQSELVHKIIQTAASFIPVLEDASSLLGELDVLLSFATAAISSQKPFVRPIMKEKTDPNPEIILKGARHPCLEVQDGIHFIDNDLIMRKKDSSFVIITGPNMGGKSTYIRQAGVVCLLAQIGCFVPCDEATITIRDCILARIGASDAQSRGVSTFMAEMLETSTILNCATSDSLIIIDELGRGTSTFDGFGLAYAISEYIITKIGAFCFFATHFHELTSLANYHPCVKNLHVTAETSDSTIVMLYGVKEGVCAQSFGIHVAELAKFPEEVISVAKRKANELETAKPTDNENEPKKRKIISGSKDEQVKFFLKGFCQTDVSNLSNEQILKQVGQWQKDIEKIESIST